jgi:hypothetical protein
MVESREDVAVSSILRLLSSRYGLPSQALAHLPTGQGAINYRAAVSDFAVFVKRHPPGTDLLSEREGGLPASRSPAAPASEFQVLRQGGKLISAVSPPDQDLAKSHGVDPGRSHSWDVPSRHHGGSE